MERVASILLDTPLCIDVNGTKPEGSSTSGADSRFFLGGWISPVAILTSVAVTRPNSPVPVRVARSNLAFLARARAIGVAAITPGRGVCFGLVGVDVSFAGLAGPADLAASTSEAVIRSPGPVPDTVDIIFH